MSILAVSDLPALRGEGIGIRWHLGVLQSRLVHAG
jgi:hypothetical protein